MFFDSGEHEEALTYYLKAFQIAPETENLSLFIAITYYKLGDTANAQQYYTIALFSNPDASTIFKDICPEVTSDPSFSQIIG